MQIEEEVKADGDDGEHTQKREKKIRGRIIRTKTRAGTRRKGRVKRSRRLKGE